MMKRIHCILSLLVLTLTVPTFAQKQVKNVILMIPDGCSTELLSIGRWLNNGLPLALDQHIKGLVRTYCSDSPIGDSAPTGSTYATGHRSREGYIATYPDQSMDRFGSRNYTDSNLAFRPMLTLMEEARRENMSTGLVFTCYFPHATPASFLAHTPNRNDNPRISKQMVHQACDVMLGGGSYFVDSSFSLSAYNAAQTLKEQGISYYTTWSDCQKAVKNGQRRLWGLFSPMEMDYEIDRDTSKQPSLAEMTRMDIDLLSENPEGFLLMVEGSKIDWGAHNQDAPATIHDFLAFNQAVEVAMDFAQANQETLVIVVPDHQTGGITLGSPKSSTSYARLSKDSLFSSFYRYRSSAERCAFDIKEKLQGEDAIPIIQEYLHKQLGLKIHTDKAREIQKLSVSEKSIKDCTRAITRLMQEESYLGWTTYGHHGGDVFLCIYGPQPTLGGVVDNQEIAPFIANKLGWKEWREKSISYFCELEKSLPTISIHKTQEKLPNGEPDMVKVIIRNSQGKKINLNLKPNTRYARIGKEDFLLPDIFVYNGHGYYLGQASVKTIRDKAGLR